jgi:hypothetical protein
MLRRPALHAGILAAYALLAVGATWPLAGHLKTHLLGMPCGDTGVYVWNTWVFRHEIADGRWPFQTSTILAPEGPVQLAFHNYAPFAGLLTMPLAGLGVVGAFNLVSLLSLVLAGYATFLLVHDLTRRVPDSWLAGAMLAVSPALVARSQEHLSLLLIAPLPLLLLALARAERHGYPLRWAVAAGLALGWAGWCDPYYAVYGGIFVLLFFAHRLIDVTFVAPRRVPGALVAVTAAGVASAILTAAILAAGGFEFAIAGATVGARSLYTPVLALVLSALAGGMLWRTPRVTRRHRGETAGLAAFGVVASLVAGAVLAPILVAAVRQVVDGGYEAPPLHWRTSPPGVDLLAFVAPNPQHPLAGSAVRDWLAAKPNGFVENVASLPLTALAPIALGAALGVVPRFWLGFGALFAVLALGPFVTVAGINTYVPGPWALLRYVPVLEAARSPTRFALVATLACAVLLGLALAALAARVRRRPLVLAVVGVALLFELLPAPRTLHAAAVPAFYYEMAADPRPGRVLELPFGLRDGASSLGDFSASSQYFQTAHGRPLLGGYLSRLPAQKRRVLRAMAVLHVLATLSEGRQPDERALRRAWAERRWFLRRADILYVVVDRERARPELEAFARTFFDLELMDEAGGRVFYRVGQAAKALPAPPARDPSRTAAAARRL